MNPDAPNPQTELALPSGPEAEHVQQVARETLAELL